MEFNPLDLKNAHFHIIGVATDIDDHKAPDLNLLLKASSSVGMTLKKGDSIFIKQVSTEKANNNKVIFVFEGFQNPVININELILFKMSTGRKKMKPMWELQKRLNIKKG